MGSIVYMSACFLCGLWWVYLRVTRGKDEANRYDWDGHGRVGLFILALMFVPFAAIGLVQALGVDTTELHPLVVLAGLMGVLALIHWVSNRFIFDD